MIVVNGKENQWQENLTIEDLLIRQDLKKNPVLIQVNNQFIDPSEYQKYVIPDGVDIKFFNILSGG